MHFGKSFCNIITVYLIVSFITSYAKSISCFRSSEIKQSDFNTTLVLIAGFRAGLAGLNLYYPENPALKPRKPS